MYLECPEGSFGKDCQGTCDCGRHFVCNHVTGECKCKPGHRGKHCTRGIVDHYC